MRGGGGRGTGNGGGSPARVEAAKLGRPCPRRGGRAGPGPSRAARAGGAAQREQPVAAGDARAGPFLLGPFPQRRLSAPGACGGSALGARAVANRGFSPLASLLGSETLRHRRGSGIRRSAAGLGPPAGCRQRPLCRPARLSSAQPPFVPMPAAPGCAPPPGFVVEHGQQHAEGRNAACPRLCRQLPLCCAAQKAF